MTITDRLRAEHDHLMVGVEELRHTGDLIGTVGRDAAQEAVERAIGFLHERLIPHARSEEEFLYPVVARVLGSLRSTRTMVRDHTEVKRLTAQLVRAAEENDEAMMRRLLYGLYHMIRVHFAKEEEIYLPLLEEGLGEVKGEELWHSMHAA
jgi:iron-sulfur cluster repair protein YtfE (RIC family)